MPALERGARRAPDPDRYADIAASLLDRGELGYPPPGASPTTIRGPAFPAWLALGMTLGGRGAGWLSIWASLPGVLAAAAVAAMLVRSHGSRVALAGGLLVAVHPLPCFVSSRLFPDETYGAALLVGLASWRAALRSGALGWASLAGGSLAFAALTRTTALAVLAGIAAIHLAARPRRPAALAVLLATALVPIGAWGWRSTALAGRPTLVEPLTGYNWWLGEADGRFGFGASPGESRERALDLMAREAGTAETASPTFWYGTLDPAGAASFDRRLVAAAVAETARRPWAYVRRCVAGSLWYWIRADGPARTAQYALVALPFLGLALIGLARAVRQPSPDGLPALLALGVAVLHATLYASICPMARYSVQLYPVLGYFAGIGLGGFRPSTHSVQSAGSAASSLR